MTDLFRAAVNDIQKTYVYKNVQDPATKETLKHLINALSHLLYFVGTENKDLINLKKEMSTLKSILAEHGYRY